MESIKQFFAGRPHWMNAVMLFCAYMTFIYMPFDMFFKPVSEDQEVWFGILLTGWAAKATEPLHWVIYGAGLYGFIKMKSWMWPWASLYVAQIAFSMMVWSMMDDRGSLLSGLISGGIFLGLAILFWRARPLFRGPGETDDNGITELVESNDRQGKDDS